MDDDGRERAPLVTRAATGLAVGGVAALLGRDLDLPSLVSFWGDRTPLVVAATLAFAVLWTTRLRKALLALTLALAGLWLAAGFSPLSAWLAEGLVQRDPVEAADAVFVLASRLQEDGELTGTAMTRLLHGLELLAEGHAPRLLLSELPEGYRQYAPAARGLMSRLRLPGELLTVGPVRNTHDEAVAVAALLRERGWRRLLMVTSPTHSRRAAAVFEHEGVAVISSPATEIQFDLESLARPDERLNAFGDLIHERVGLAVYRWRGWIN